MTALIRPRPALRTLATTALATTALATTVLLAGCATSGSGPTEVLERAAAQPAAQPAAGAVPEAAVPAAAETCSPAAQASYRPAAGFPAGSLQAQIKARGKLVVGISGDTRLLGARDSLNGGKPTGFDIEMARVVARAIFGDSGDVDSRIQFKVITGGQRFPQVNDGVAKGGVDLVARAVSMTCDRWQNADPTKGSAFSAAYFKSDQRILVRSDSPTQTIEALAKVQAKVCAPNGSTSLTNLKKVTGINAIAVDIHSDCLALWQEGRVDAITGDDAILAGFADQDPRARVVGAAMDTTYYGLAVARSQIPFVRFVNAALASPEGRSAWSAAYDATLKRKLPPQSEPEPDYSRG